MQPAATQGDVTLAARPATRETFAPYGRLLRAGRRTVLGRKRRVLTALSEVGPGPRRVGILGRYPHARRAMVALGDAPLWLVVLGGGDTPTGPAAAFTVPPGALVVIEQGVWHAGPLPLAETTVLEMLETSGAADRFDRKPVQELLGASALRVVLPDEPGAPPTRFDLDVPGAIRLDGALEGRVRLGCQLFEGLRIEDHDARVHETLVAAADRLRGRWGRAASLAQVPGVKAARDLFVGMGQDKDVLSPLEGLLERALAGGSLAAEDSLSEVLALCALRHRVPLIAFDADGLAGPVLVRPAGPDEADPGGGAEEAVGPLFCDGDGPFGSPFGSAPRAAVTPHARRVLVSLFLAPDQAGTAVDGLLEEVARTVCRYCGGTTAGRLVVG